MDYIRIFNEDQNITSYALINTSNGLLASQKLMANETMIRLNSLTKRCDTVVYDNSLRPVVICEFKKPDIEITQQVFDQVVRYNIVLKVKYLIVSNGMSHYCCKMNYEDMSFDYLQEIPEYGDL